MNRIPELIQILKNTIERPVSLVKNIERFQTIVWHSEHGELGGSPKEQEVLGELAYDLDFYVANKKDRAEDPSYFGEDKAIDKIRQALINLDKIKQS